MSPELFFPKEFGLKDRRPTKSSDCYALGMVIYEVLSGQKPFSGYEGYDIVVRIHRGKRPARPRGGEGRLFTDDIRNILERCWKRSPGERPGVGEVLHCLEVSSSWTPPETVVNSPTTDPSSPNLNSSSEESTNEGQVSSPSVAPSQSLQTIPSKGDADRKRPHQPFP